MNRILRTLLILIALGSSVPARTQSPTPRLDRIEAVKVGMITRRLGLTTAQAERFWPVYHRYEAERRALIRSLRPEGGAGRPASDAEAHRQLQQRLAGEEALVGLKRTYQDDFLSAITATQLAELYEVERDFNRMLMQRLNKAGDTRGGRRGAPGRR